MAKALAKKKKSIEIKDLSKFSFADLSKDQLRKITGGVTVKCPPACDTLEVTYPSDKTTLGLVFSVRARTTKAAW